MKALLILVLVGVIAFLAYQNHEKKLTMEMMTNEQSSKDAIQREEDLKDKVRKATMEAQTLKQERDDARRQLVAANEEIARLTRTTPKPVTWFDKRLEENSGRLNATPGPAASVHRQVFPTPQN